MAEIKRSVKNLFNRIGFYLSEFWIKPLRFLNTGLICSVIQHFLQIEYKTEAIIHVLHLIYRKLADPFSKERFVQGDNLGNVSHRIL